jgi:hypothetical protein
VRTAAAVDAAALAGRFGGGGHPRAAGFPLALDLPAARAHVIPALLAALDSERGAERGGRFGLRTAADAAGAVAEDVVT